MDKMDTFQNKLSHVNGVERKSSSGLNHKEMGFYRSIDFLIWMMWKGKVLVD